MGFRIFAHALRLVFGNLGDALRISGILFLMASGATLASANLLPPNGGPLRATIALLALLFGVALNVWIAVAWHRYVLLDERPQTVVPPINGSRMLAYLGYSALLVLVGVIAGVVILVAFTLLSALNAPQVLTVPAAIVVFLAILAMSYRLSIILPASSVEKSLGLRQAWAATTGTTWTMLGIALLTLIFFFVLAVPGALLAYAHLTLAAELCNAVFGWVTLMVGVAVVTTIYGHYVEGRTIR